MAYLVDTSVLARMANKLDPAYSVAAYAVVELHHRGETLHITPQNLIEFRNIATRPVPINGLGLSIADAETQASRFETAFPLLPDRPDVFPAWKVLVQNAAVIGKQVHDARLIAVCHVYGITHLLTFNIGHFARVANMAPGVVIVDPRSV
jgi:predicted nucleic acid-binding protein